MTINTTDPLERLRAVNPVPAAEVARIVPDPALLRRIVAGQSPVVAGGRPPRRRGGRRLVPVLLATSILGGAVGYAVLRGGVSAPETVACYEQASLQASTEVAPAGSAGPVEACTGLWLRGVFGARTEIPPLAACVLPSGVAGVFPAPGGIDVCTALNLVPISAVPAQPVPSLPTQPTTLPASTTSTVPPPAGDLNSRIVAFRDSVVDQFLASPCMPPQAGEAIVRRELERFALRDWTVVAGNFSADRPCATLSLRAEERQVLLVPSTPRR